MASFALGWAVTITAGIASYPLDTIRRRMMMTSGEAVKYKSSFDCGAQIIAKEVSYQNSLFITLRNSAAFKCARHDANAILNLFF